MNACPLCPKKGKVISGNLWIPQMLLEFWINRLLSYKQVWGLMFLLLQPATMGSALPSKLRAGLYPYIMCWWFSFCRILWQGVMQSIRNSKQLFSFGLHTLGNPGSNYPIWIFGKSFVLPVEKAYASLALTWLTYLVPWLYQAVPNT